MWLCCIALMLSLVGACGDDGGRAEPAKRTTTGRPGPSTPPSWTPTTAAPPEEAAVGAAYEAASRAFIEAAAIPDPEYPGLAATHVDPMLSQRRQTLLALKAEGRVIRYPERSQYRIVVADIEIDHDVARLTACVVDDGERVEVGSGRVLASGVGTIQWSAALRQIEGTWRLAERAEEKRWEGVAGCALE